MMKREKTPVERYHDRVAGIYDTIYDRDPYWETVFEITWRHLRRFLPRDTNARCLDVGCGTGRWGLKLLKCGYPTDFLDISHAMLDQVSCKLARHFPAASSELLWASIDDLAELPDERYDLILGQGDPLSCAERPERALKELVRILKPGGVLVMSVDNRLAAIPHFLEIGDRKGLERFLRDGMTHWLTDDTNEQYSLTMFGPDEIRAMCKARGLTLLHLIGKTVLPLRRHAELLADAKQRRAWIALEESLHAREAMLGQAPHLEFVARKEG